MYKFWVYCTDRSSSESVALGIGELLVMLKLKQKCPMQVDVACRDGGWRAIPFHMINFEEMVVCYPDADARGSAWRNELLGLNAQVFDNPLSIN
jgi:hypothetical protein